MLRRSTSALLWCAPLFPALAVAQPNPFDGDRAALRAGAALFGNRCATCHGADARGGLSGPDLTELWREGAADGYVFDVIRDGIAGSVMPTSSAPDNELWAMVAYVKSLGTVAQESYAAGDAERGRLLFGESCARCHAVAGAGGRLGPDLTRITLARPREVIERSIREPDAAVAAGYRTVRVTSGDGPAVTGTLKGEDAFSLQLMDTRQRLRAYLKRDLVELRRLDASVMPAFGPEELNDRSLDDLLSYLASTGAR